MRKRMRKDGAESKMLSISDFICNWQAQQNQIIKAFDAPICTR